MSEWQAHVSLTDRSLIQSKVRKRRVGVNSYTAPQAGDETMAFFLLSVSACHRQRLSTNIHSFCNMEQFILLLCLIRFLTDAFSCHVKLYRHPNAWMARGGGEEKMNMRRFRAAHGDLQLGEHLKQTLTWHVSTQHSCCFLFPQVVVEAADEVTLPL